jgi:hypothetical protein
MTTGVILQVWSSAFRPQSVRYPMAALIFSTPSIHRAFSGLKPELRTHRTEGRGA